MLKEFSGLEFNKCNSLCLIISHKCKKKKEAFVNSIKIFELKKLFYYLVSIYNELFHSYITMFSSLSIPYMSLNFKKQQFLRIFSEFSYMLGLSVI